MNGLLLLKRGQNQIDLTMKLVRWKRLSTPVLYLHLVSLHINDSPFRMLIFALNDFFLLDSVFKKIVYLQIDI